MDLLSPILPPGEAGVPSSVSSTLIDPPSALVEDLWDWRSPLGGPHVAVRTARLIPRLREVAARRNAQQALIDAALERVRAVRTGGSLDISNALADLAVSGRAAFTHFLSIAPTEANLLPILMAAPGRPSGMTNAEATRALSDVLDRAYSVMWALRGAPSQRAAMRPGLGWIAVSSEDDPAHAPVNISCAADPMGEINIAGLAVPVTCRVSLKLPSPVAAMPMPSLRSFPSTTAWRQFSDLLTTARPAHYDELFLFIHGLGSRLEEADGFKQALIQECGRRGRRVAVLSVDLPGFGYSSRLDFDRVVGGRPARFDKENPIDGSSFPFLTLFRNALETLSNHVAGGFQYVIGGSLGGNLVLRLAETKENRRFILPDTLLRFVSWSPASIWESWERAQLVDDTPLPGDDRTYFDFAKHEMVRQTRDNMNTVENAGSRGIWFDWIQRGSRFLHIFRLSGWVASEDVTRGFLLYMTEMYSADWRRTFWATSHEQLIFSHQEPLCPHPGTGAATWGLRTINRPLFILSGARDGGGPEHSGLNPLDYYRNVERVSRESPNVPGQRMLLLQTGHSVCDERPRWLSRRIAEFLCSNMRRVQVFVLSRSGSVINGHICDTAAGDFGPARWQALDGTNIRQIAATTNLDGRVQLLAVGGDGICYSRYQHEPYGEWNTESWESLGGTGLRQLIAGKHTDGRIQLLALNEGGVVLARHQQTANRGWSTAGWQALGRNNVRQIAVGGHADGRIQVLALNNDGSVHGLHQQTPNGAWNATGWEPFGGSGIQQIILSKHADGRMQIFALGGDGVVYGRYQTAPNRGWNPGGWESLEGRNIRQIAVCPNADGRMQLIALGSDGVVYSRYQTAPNRGWNAERWESMAGRDIRQISISAHGDGRLLVFAVGGDGMVYIRYQTRPNGSWNTGGWQVVGGESVSQITTLSAV